MPLSKRPHVHELPLTPEPPAQARNVEYHLRAGTLLRNARHAVNRMYDLCGHSTLHVLGVTNSPGTEPLHPSWVHAATAPDRAVPDIRCARASSIQIILFRRPRPRRMQYMSLSPIELDLDDRYLDAPTSSLEAENDRQERERREEKLRLVDKLRQHIVARRVPSPKEKTLPLVVDQINWAWEVEQLLQRNLHLVGARPRRSLSVSERVVESATTFKDAAVGYTSRLLGTYALPVLHRAFVLVLLAHRVAAELLLAVLEFRARPHHPALKDVSALAQQVEIRLQQSCYWPVQNMTLRRRKRDWASVTTSHPDYIRFFNSLWLVANDVIIGIAMGSYLIEHCGWVGGQIGVLLRTYTVEALRSSITWLMGWPAGLKLNNELGAFLGDLFLWVIDYWSGKTSFPPSKQSFLALDNCSLPRLHHRPPPNAPRPNLVHRHLQLRRRQHAARHLLGPPLGAHDPHLLVLPRVGTHLQLAAQHPGVALPPLPRQEAQRAA